MTVKQLRDKLEYAEDDMVVYVLTTPRRYTPISTVEVDEDGDVLVIPQPDRWKEVRNDYSNSRV